jgi:PRTRC genetic system protein B
MQDIKVAEYRPESLVVIYKGNGGYHHNSYYVEHHSIHQGKPLAGKALTGEDLVDFTKAITAVEKATKKQARTFYLDGLIPSNLHWFEVKNKSLAWSPSLENRTLCFTKKTGIKSGVFPLPKLVFFAGKGSFYVFCYKDSVFSEKTELFHAPFPNVYENGTVCFGDCKISTSYSTVQQAMLYWENFFFNSFFTDHGVDSGHLKLNVSHLWNSLEGSTAPFPAERLVAHSTTVSTILNTLK